MTHITHSNEQRHIQQEAPFGQSNPKVENLNMLCSDLPQRIYESLKTLCCLASATGPLRAHEIAAADDLPPAQTAKILQLMTWAGFVKSRRGTKGGFWLARQANSIRVTDVTDFFARQGKAGRSHEQDGLLKALASATARCQKEFSRITVADLAMTSGGKPTQRRTSRSFSTRGKEKPGGRRSGSEGG